MLSAIIQKNDKQAKILIGVVSFVVFIAVVILSEVKLDVEPGFDVHIFARINAVLNSAVAVLLVAALVAVKQKKYELHKRLMLVAIVLSALFLISYIAHHLLADSTSHGGVGLVHTIYLIILITHIFLAAIILPFILFTAYRALIAEWPAHKKIARITWPIWFYVAVTGVLVYLMISPYYS
jgi:putative membrane protein